MKKLSVIIWFLITMLFMTLIMSGCNRESSTLLNSSVKSTTIPTSITLAASDTISEKKAQADIICDGIKDSITIANAISSLRNGGDVFLLAGTYNLEQRLLVVGVNNITLQGEGTSTILKQNKAFKTSLSLPVNAGQNKVSVTDTTGLMVGQDIYMGSTSGTKQTQDTARAPYWEAQRMVGPSGESNIITEINGHTLSLYHNLTNSYAGNEDLWTIYDATYFRHCKNLKVLNLTLDGNRENLITTTGDIFMNGLRFTGCDDLEVAGCYVHDVYYNHIMTHPGPCLRANIHDNIVTTATVSGDEQTRGIVVEAFSDNSIVENNQITGHETGIYNVGSIVSIKNNICSDNELYGIFLNRGYNCVICDNTIKEANHAGIEILNREVPHETYHEAANNSVFNNTIISTRSGQAIDIVGANYVSITNNNIENSGKKGIRVLGATHCNISGNYIIDAGQVADASFPGIELAMSPDKSLSRFNEIRGNFIYKTLANNLNYCIYLDETSVDNIITDNDLSGFAISAIYLGSSGNTVDGNTGSNEE